MLIHFDWPPPDGLAYTLNNGFRNGVAPSGEKLRRVFAGVANSVATQRQKVLFTKSIRYTEGYNTATAADTWRFQFHTGPNVAEIRLVMVVGKGDWDPATAARNPKVTWTTTIIGGASTTQTALYHGDFDIATSVITPNDMSVITQTWAVNADTSYRAQMEQADQLRVLSVTVYEVPKTVADSSDTNIIDPTKYSELARIYDREAAEVQAVITKMWKTMGTHHLAFCVDSTTGQTNDTITWNNLVDGTSTAIGTNTQGFNTYPLYHGALDGFDSGASTEVIPVTLYAYMQTANASNQAEVRFADATGIIGTLTSTSTSGEWVTSNVNWTASTSDSFEKIDVQFRNATAGTLTTVMAAGLYEYEA